MGCLDAFTSSHDHLGLHNSNPQPNLVMNPNDSVEMCLKQMLSHNLHQILVVEASSPQAIPDSRLDPA